MSEARSGQDKRVTWAELFFDLVFVFAVTQVSALLAEHHRWWGITQAVIVLIPVYITWTAATFQSNRIGQDAPKDRIGLFGLGLCGLLMAIALPQVYEDGAILYASAYLLARLILVLRSRWRLSLPWTIALSVTGPLVIVGAFLPALWREVFWGVAALIDLVMPLVVRRRITDIAYDGHHLGERFGLLVLIALGESLLGIGLPLARQPQLPSALELLGALAAFVLVCAMWWTYFDAFNETMITALTADRTRIFTYQALYGHLAMIAAIILVAVGFENMITRPGDAMTFTHLTLLYGGTALFLIAIAYLIAVGSRRAPLSLAGAAIVLIVLVPIAMRLSGVVATTLAASVLVALSVVDRLRQPAERASPLDDIPS
jgi:low temperature requirement protein LtrA